jgi:cyclopropane fatty-acyl-phospholipid synthase-like methyltransferase
MLINEHTTGMIRHEGKLGHLGGYFFEGDIATTYPTLWSFLIKNLNLKSVLDIGCGRGFTLQHFKNMGVDVTGIEGCPLAIEHSLLKDNIKHHDFTLGVPILNREFDLVYCVEVVEHIEEQYKENFLKCFDLGKYILMTHAGPGQGGHHHVNCQPAEYWISEIEKRGYIYNSTYTRTLKQFAKADRLIFCPDFDGNHFEHRGLFFQRK